jgi:hypothetical protein
VHRLCYEYSRNGWIVYGLLEESKKRKLHKFDMSSCIILTRYAVDVKESKIMTPILKFFSLATSSLTSLKYLKLCQIFC